MNRYPKTQRMIGAMALACLLAACTTVPATFERIRGAVEDKETVESRLGRLIDLVADEPDTPRSAEALGDFVEIWKNEGYGRDRVIKSPDGGKPFKLRVIDHVSPEYAIDEFDQLLPASDFRVRGISHHRRPGVGTPLVAVRQNLHREPIESFYPGQAITRPITAVATVTPAGAEVREVTIRFLCPLTHDHVDIGGRRMPLAADFSTPWAALLSRTGELHRSGILDVLTVSPRHEPRLYLTEPYDRNKEPLIMIHGLISTPLAWAGLSNDLWADDMIRHRYQIWHYHYNTAAPALYSARILREQLGRLRSLLDPDGDDPASRRTTIIAHSMGGLIAKALVVEPRDAFWKAAFNVKPAQLKLSTYDRVALNEAFQWKPDRSVHRIIYIAVPHRGSSYADNPVGRLGRFLAAPPKPFQDFYLRVSKDNPGVFTDAYAELGSGHLNSIGSLSPNQPTLKILADLPYAHPVETHSIIGDRGRTGGLEKSSDGIVPYASSHLPDADSELVVPSDHGAYRHPDAIAEIRRVLTLR